MQQNWRDLAESYRELAELRPDWVSYPALGDLCAKTASSNFGSALYADISIDKLIIAQVPITRSLRPEIQILTIEPVDRDQIEFRFFDTWIEKKQWKRSVPSNAAYERFVRFLRQVGWVYN